MDHDIDRFLEMAAYGEMSAVSQMLSEGIDVNARNHHEETALIAAADAGQTELVRFLLERGADVNAADEEQWTAVQEAAQVNAVETVRALLDHGADMMAQNRIGWNLEFIARRNKNDALIALVGSYYGAAASVRRTDFLASTD